MLEEEDLKKEINNFVWMHADGGTTLDDAEMIANTIFELLRPAPPIDLTDNLAVVETKP